MTPIKGFTKTGPGKIVNVHPFGGGHRFGGDSCPPTTFEGSLNGLPHPSDCLRICFSRAFLLVFKGIYHNWTYTIEIYIYIYVFFAPPQGA